MHLMEELFDEFINFILADYSSKLQNLQKQIHEYQFE